MVVVGGRPSRSLMAGHLVVVGGRPSRPLMADHLVVVGGRPFYDVVGTNCTTADHVAHNVT